MVTGPGSMRTGGAVTTGIYFLQSGGFAEILTGADISLCRCYRLGPLLDGFPYRAKGSLLIGHEPASNMQ